MSRVYQALEKAEKEKREQLNEKPVFKILKEEIVSEQRVLAVEPPKKEEPDLHIPKENRDSILFAPPGSFAAEQFRKLKTEIFHRFPNPPHIILVTSTAPEEGKTMVSVNLATAIAEEFQKKAILIDGDLRKPGIHLGTDRNPGGLAEYLSDHTSFPEILTESGLENLKVISAGRPSRKASELVGSTRMKELFTWLRKSEDTYIIIDSTPIISTTEPALLSKLVDGVVFVVMAGKTPREMVRRALKSIDQEKIVGVVFNQRDVGTLEGYPEYYYQYYKKYQ